MKLNKEHTEYLKKNYGKNILPLSILDNEYYPGTNPLEILFFWNRESSDAEARESILKTIKHYNLFSSRLIMTEDNKFALQYCTDGAELHFWPRLNIAYDDVNIDDIKKMISLKTYR